jgi:hypothetical protein
MRQIKFRAWHKRAKKMFLPEEMGQDEMCLSPDSRGFVNVSGISTKLSQYFPEMIPEQFTGLLDKNGKEIYEGDIVNGYVVWYCDKTLMWSLPRRDDESLLDSYEIIGNIHENPEKLIERTIDEAR